jgi:hypothetical protein
LIIPSTQMTTNSPFFWNGSSKIQYFTASRCQFFENWLMKHKSANLLKPLGTIIQ